MNKFRLGYIDFCKVFAMFLVTIAHCAQTLSGINIPTLFFCNDAFIAFNMPVFMVASGFVMNIDKMRSTPLLEYVWSKFLRFIVPMTSWYVLLMIAIYPRTLEYWEAYWYLSAMFICLVVVKLLTSIISSNLMLCIISVVIVTFLPLSFLERSCFMMPFLFVGYFLRKVVNRITIAHVLSLIFLFFMLYWYWDVRYSIYIAPFQINKATPASFFSMCYRLMIGSVGGVMFISLTRVLMESEKFRWMNNIAKYGSYTLVFYTMSFVLNALLARIVWRIGYITTTFSLNVVACSVTIAMMILMCLFQKTFSQNKVFSLLLGFASDSSKIASQKLTKK